MSQSKRVYSVEFKERAVHRMLSGETVGALHRELQVPRRDLYEWRDAYCREGVQGLRGAGRPREGQRPPTGDSAEEIASRRVAELERKMGQPALLSQGVGGPALEIDFLERAFQRVKESRQKNTAAGATASRGRFEAGCRWKA